MSTHTPITIWPECWDHTCPDDDSRYECKAGNASCLTHPLIEHPPPARWDTVQVLCETCTAFVAAMGWWEGTHDSGEDVDGMDITICKTGEPYMIACRECTDAEDDGDWRRHR